MSHSDSERFASPAIPDPAARRRWRYVALAIILSGVALAVGWGWKLWSRPKPVEPPILDPVGIDSAVWHTVERATVEVRRTPDSSRAWGRLGMIYLAHQFRTEAGVCLARAEQLDAREVRWPYYQALAVRLSDPEASIAHLRRTVALAAEEDAAPRSLLGELLIERGKIDEAEMCFQNILNRDPHNSRAHLGFARVAFERDNLQNSLAHLREVKANSHARKAAHVLLAEIHQRRGDRKAAEDALRQARRLPDDDPWPDPLDDLQELVTGRKIALQRAKSLLRQQRLSEAIALLQQTVQDYPESSTWLLLGQAQLLGQNVPAAEQALRTALQKEPNSVEANFHLGVLLLFLRSKPQEAAWYFRKTTELKPNYARAYYNLGECLNQQGDRPHAIAAYRNAITCDPQDSKARTNLGRLLARDGQMDAALEQLQQAVREAPDNSDAKQLLESVRKQIAQP